MSMAPCRFKTYTIFLEKLQIDTKPVVASHFVDKNFKGKFRSENDIASMFRFWRGKQTQGLDVHFL